MGKYVEQDSALYSYLKFPQSNNNCWVNAAGIGLQFLNHPDAPVAGQENKFYDYCCQLLNTTSGSCEDPRDLLVKLLAEEPSWIRLHMACKCGTKTLVFNNPILYLCPRRFEPVNYCSNCSNNTLLYGVDVVGSACFIYNPTCDKVLLNDCLHFNYSDIGGGHYMVSHSRDNGTWDGVNYVLKNPVHCATLVNSPNPTSSLGPVTDYNQLCGVSNNTSKVMAQQVIQGGQSEKNRTGSTKFRTYTAKHNAGRDWFKCVCNVGKLFYYLFLLRAIILLLLRWVPVVCSGYHTNFRRTFIKSDACGLDPLCRVCLLDTPDLGEFTHLKLPVTYLTRPWKPMFITAFKLVLAMLALPGRTKLFGLTLLVGYFYHLLGEYEIVTSSLVLDYIPYEPLFLYTLFLGLGVRVYSLVGHLINGCTSPRCLMCNSKASTYTVSLPLGGVIRNFMIRANGVGVICKKHSFYCKSCGGRGGTVITPEASEALSKQTGLSVKPTMVSSYHVVSKVLFAPQGYTLEAPGASITVSSNSGSDVTDAVKTGITDGVVFFDEHTETLAVLNAPALAQSLGRPVFLVDRRLFNSAAHQDSIVFLQSLPIFSACNTLLDCLQVVAGKCGQVSLELLRFCEQYKVPITTEPYNNGLHPNLRRHFPKCGPFLITNRYTWNMLDFDTFTLQQKLNIYNACTGGGKMFTLTISGVKSKLVGGSSGFFSMLLRLLFMFAIFFLITGPVHYRPDVQEFLVLEGGSLSLPRGPYPCVYNHYPAFDEEHYERYGYVPSKSPGCPIVVALTADLSGFSLLPDLNVYLAYDRGTHFALPKFYAEAPVVYSLFTDDTPYFMTLCTRVNNFKRDYCVRDELIPGAISYNSLPPLTLLETNMGNFKLPLAYKLGNIYMYYFSRGDYCIGGVCGELPTQVCVTIGHFRMGEQNLCFDTLSSVVTKTLGVYSLSLSTPAGLLHLTANCVLLLGVFVVCFLLTKVRRALGIYADTFFHAALAFLFNTVGYLFVNTAVGPIYLAFYVVLSWSTGHYIIYMSYFFLTYGCTLSLPLLLALACTVMVYYLPRFIMMRTLYSGVVPCNFDEAAVRSFVITSTNYGTLMRGLNLEDLENMVTSAKRVSKVSGPISPSDFRLAARGALASSLISYSKYQHDVLHLPPSYSVTGALQAGLRKLVNLSGPLEKCLVAVGYGSTSLNGVWLGDCVICPRHLCSPDCTKSCDYDLLLPTLDTNAFTVSAGSRSLAVQGVQMKGSLLYLRVDQSNPNTPKYRFVPATPGSSFTIMLGYAGVPLGLYGVVMNSDGTINGSFLAGACGSIGFTEAGGMVSLHYVHHMQLSSGAHVGSDLEGTMYGGFVDQPVPQHSKGTLKNTVNTLAFLTAARGNGYCLGRRRLTIIEYNVWAQKNGYTLLEHEDSCCFVRRVGGDLEIMLGFIADNAGSLSKPMLGFNALTDEFTPQEVLLQLIPSLQSSVGQFFYGFVNYVLLFSALMVYFRNPFKAGLYFILAALGVLQLRYQRLYCLSVLLPVMLLFTLEYFDMLVVLPFWSYGFLLIRALKSASLGGLLSLLWTYFSGLPGLSLDSLLISCTPLSSLQVTVYTLLQWYFQDRGDVFICYLLLGGLVYSRWGLLACLNKLFRLSIGEPFKVNYQEYRYMQAKGLQPPTGPMSALKLACRLAPLAGKPTLVLGSVQSTVCPKAAATTLYGLFDKNMSVSVRDCLVRLHNKIMESKDQETILADLVTLVVYYLSQVDRDALDKICHAYFSEPTVVQALQEEAIHCSSWLAFREAQDRLEQAVKNGATVQELKALRKAANVARSVYDKDLSTSRKLDRLAAAATKALFKEQRISNTRQQVLSSAHAVLINLLKHLNLESIDGVLKLARDGVVPLGALSELSAGKIQFIIPDHSTLQQLMAGSSIVYAGKVWNVMYAKNASGQEVPLLDLVNSPEQVEWPVHVIASCFQLQNNELAPTTLVKRIPYVYSLADGSSVKTTTFALHDKGNAYFCALLCSEPDLTVVTTTGDDPKTLNLDPPIKVDMPGGYKFLYYTQGLNTYRRGLVLGSLAATLRLQAGTPTELAVNSPLLTQVAFSHDPVATYLSLLKAGNKPLTGCILVKCSKLGNGRAVTMLPEATESQDSYGGASVCLSCRAYIEHECGFKGKFVQIPKHTSDPVGFVSTHQVCKGCGFWVNVNCSCGVPEQQSLNCQGVLVRLD